MGFWKTLFGQEEVRPIVIDLPPPPEPATPEDETRLDMVGHDVSVNQPSPKRALARRERLRAWMAEQEAKGTGRVTEAHRKELRILEAVTS